MIEPGTLLQNRYRVTRQIGRGGMGAVYVATDERFNSTVAIKQTFFFDDPALRKAFEREAVLLNHLRHPALPRVSDHFVEEEGQFLVMEYIAGHDLGELLKARGGWFPLTEVLAWADELLDALEYLHTQEPPVIHRDIKPQNIKRTERGRMVLLDFGLAKGNPSRAGQTATGSVLGYSPTYAPLEQVQGTGTDACSDIYSLGATLYHLLTGEPPVDALTRAAAVVNNEADPLRPVHLVQPHVPVAVSRCIRRALAQKAALRPRSAAEMRELLRQAASGEAQTAPAASAQQTNGDATVVDSMTKASGQSYYFGETTLDAARVGARPYATGASPYFDAEPERRSFGAAAKLLVAAAVVAICAAVAYPLLSARAPEAKPATPSVSTTPADESTAGAEIEAPGTQRPNKADASLNSSTAASAAPTPAKASEASEPQTDSGANNAGVAAEPKQTATPQNTSPIIVVINPTPTPAAEAPDESDEAARRAQDERRRQQAGPPPYGGQPPPGGMPPPPPRGGPPPPPPRRPPY
ncbi:MAG: protein kinase domain-containing protein [Pyrinomonadaceae bacterium]